MKQYHKTLPEHNQYDIRPIMELLGSSETTGPQAASTPGPGTRPGSVGRSFPHFQTVVDNGDGQGKIQAG